MNKKDPLVADLEALTEENLRLRKIMSLKTIEITRSFSYKHGLPNYSSVDFFSSHKDTCAPEDADKVSDQLHQMAKADVQKSLAEFLTQLAEKEKAEMEADRKRNVEKQNAKSKTIEEKEKAKQGSELDAGQNTKEDLTK